MEPNEELIQLFKKEAERIPNRTNTELVNQVKLINELISQLNYVKSVCVAEAKERGFIEELK